MKTVINYSILLFSFFCIEQSVVGQEWVSPCPRLFTYDTQNNERGKWFGIVTLLSDSDLSGVWLRLIFDRPSIQLGNWFGQVDTTDNVEYLVKNRNHKLKAGTPHTLRFYIQYNENEPAPKLVSFRLNAKVVCPEGAITTPAPSTVGQLQTSSALGVVNPTPAPAPAPAPPRPNNNAVGGNKGPIFGGDSSAGSDEDDFFPGDFGLISNSGGSGTNRPTASSKPNFDVQCGTVVVQPRPLITHGQATSEGEFPWHAALYHARGIDLAYICGGSLISKFHVITVAHCVTKRKSSSPLNPDNLVVYLGKYYLKRWSNPGVQDRQVAAIIPHPQYNPNSYSNDIALLKFAKAAEFSDYVRPVCLWEGGDDINFVLNKQGTVVGWGFDETGRVTEKLTQAKMPVVSKETCIYSFPDFFSRFTTTKTYCAGFRNGTSVCNGDSGGGMVFPKNEIGGRPVWVLRGLVSISVALQNQFRCDASHYVVFTDAAKYQNWIQQSLKV